MFNLKINMYAIYDNLNLTATFNLGNEEMVQSFFATIAYHLENKKWGSVYPALMNEFYKGKLEQKHIAHVIAEIKDIKKKLSKLDASKIVWNMEEEIQNDLSYQNTKISLDDIFINNKREKMTDIILTVLETVRNKKVPLYIGEYYYKELQKPEIADIIINTQKKQKRNNIIKYIIYLLIILIVKFTATEQQFNYFIKLFIFSMIVAELFYFHSKQIIKFKQKELEEKRQLKLNNNQPKIRIEKITLKRDLRSSMFDSVLDEIDCPKTFKGIKEKLEAQKIKNWQLDLEKIYENLGYDIEYANEMINDLEQYDKFEFYKIENISKVIPKEKRGYLYDDNNIYRIIQNDNEMYLLIFKNIK